MKYLFLLSIFLVAAKGCGDKTVEGVIVAEMGDEVSLAIGEALQIKGSKTEGFLFLNVERDSRCPKDVNCIQAGAATIAIEEMNGQPRQVNIPADSRSNPTFMINGAKVTILGLDPYPSAGSKTAPGDYRLRVQLSEGASKL